jgi:hypothetical protein
LRSARIANRLSLAFKGWRVDVLLKAHNLQEQAIPSWLKNGGVTVNEAED